MAQVSYGTITITDTNDIEKIYMEYAQSQNNQTAPTTGWDDDIPTWREGYYIWQRTVTKMSGVPLSQDSYGEPVCLTGSTGSSGAPGQSVDSIVTSYCNYGTGTPTATYSGWQSAVPAYDSTKPNYWIKTVITYSNPTTTDTKIYKDNGITSATSTAAAANTTAQNAKDKADDAWDKADNAETIAGNANTAISDLNQYFWRKKSASTNVPAGSYVTNIPGTTYQQDPANGGFNSLVQANGIFLRNGIATLSSWTGDALTFYHPTNSGQGNRGMELSSSTLKFYDSTGTVAQATFGGTQATVSGTINVYDGKIGNASNYWYIGNYTDYNQNDSAIIKSIGTASIQLNETNTWRIATNRIHTAWAPATGTDAYKLHFPIYVDSENTNRHWDYGLHLPTSYSDKFLYIRNAASSETLDNLLDDLDDAGYNYWNYIFYIDGSGNLHAGDIYSHGTLISGTSAPYLLKSGGTMTGNITMSNGAKLIGDVTGNVSGSAGKLSNTSKIGDTNKPVYFSASGVPVAISYEINKSVPSNAIFTDQNVRSTQANTTKLWLVGTPTSGDRTGELNYDSNIYADTTAGALHATTFNGYTLAAASAKGVDTSLTTSTTSTNLPTSAAVVNLIKQYLPLTGGSVTGAVTFGDSVSVDELTVGDLVVNGSASFTNNLQANTINGVAVGSNPKFTDTVTTVTVTGSGNAITGASASGGAVTLTKGTTFPTGSGTNGYLTKWTGANTIGNGPALGSDATKFLNNKGEWAVPAGTGLTSVSASGSGGITISGSPITTSGTIVIGLNLSTAINGLGEGTSSATRNDYIVAQYAGGGTTTTTYHRRSLAHIFAALNSSDITTALGYTPYNSTNPNGYTSNTGTVTSVATSSPITGGTITSSGTIGHATSGVGSAVTTVGLYKFKYDTYGHITGVTAIAKADITGLGIPAQDTTYSNASTTTAGLMSAADKKKLDDIQVDSSGQAVAANVAGRWGIDVTFSDTNVAQVGHANTAVTASNTQASTVSSATTKTALSFGSIVKLPYVSYDTYGHVTSKSEVYFQLPAAPSSTTNATNATNDSDGNPINTTYIKKSIGTAAGDIIYWSASGTPVRLAKGSNGQVLKLANGVPTWGTDNNDNTWRAIQVDGTDILGTGTNTNKLNLKAGTNISLSNSSGSVTITATDVKVTQTNTTGNADYRLLFSENANDTTSTETARKSTYLKFNPSSGLLKTYGISSASGSTPVIYSDVSATEIQAVDSSLTTSSSDSDWLKALLIALCNKYPGKSGYIFKGTMAPNSVGWYEVHIYNTSTKDSTTGLPQYSFGRFLKYINNYSLFGTASYSYSYRTVDTNTWNPLTTSQAGYVSTAPNDTTKFLRGDASWAQVSSANLSDIRLTWSGSVSTTDWILAHDTAATGTPLFRAMSPANLKTTMSLNNVENTKLSTWAGSSNITTVGTITTGTWNGSAVPVANGGTGATTAANARTNLGLGSAATASTTTSIASGGTGLPTAGTVYTYVANAISGASNTYVTIATDQTITASQKTFNGATRWSVTNSTTGSKYGACNYDATLDALVFSFGTI